MSLSKMKEYSWVCYYPIIKLLYNYHILHNFSVYEDYFSAVYHISQHNTIGRRKAHQIYLIQGILLIGSVNMIFRYLFQDTWSPLFNYAQYNVVFIEGFRRQFNGAFAIFSLASIDFYRLLYFQNTGLTCRWISRVLINQEGYLFIRPMVEIKKVDFLKKNKSNSKIVQKNVALFFREKALLVTKGFVASEICNSKCL